MEDVNVSSEEHQRNEFNPKAKNLKKKKSNRAMKNALGECSKRSGVMEGRKRREVGGSSSNTSDEESCVVRFRRPKRIKLEAKELEKLEKMVLGDGSLLLRNMSIADEDSGVDEEGGNESEFSDTLASSPERAPAWEDADDVEAVTVRDVLHMKRAKKVPLGLKPNSDYQKYLRKKFTDVYGEPSWAKLDRKASDEVDEDIAILRTSGKMIEKPQFLPKGVVEAKKMASLNNDTRNEGPVIKTVRFHPSLNVALIAGLGCTASVVQVDGLANNKLASVKFDRFPIRCARFTQDGNNFIVGSHVQSYFYQYDMVQGSSTRLPLHRNMGQSNMKMFEISPGGKIMAVAGRFGQIHLLTSDSKEWVATMTMNGSVETMCFSSNGTSLYTYGDQGEVYVWDVRSRRLIHKFQDEGSIKGVSLAVSPSDEYIAAGSASGVVNLYETRAALSQVRPTPLKAVMNLVTSATTACFNHSSQLLAIASDEKENSVKIVHVPSMTVFSNFPTLNSQYSRVQDACFSPNSGYLSLANNKSTAFLFRLKHFKNY